MAKVQFFWEHPLPYEQIVESWSAAFNRKFDPANWQWWLEDNPLGDKILAAYILEGRTLACFYAVSPRTIVSPQGKFLKSGLMNAGFTHPAYQGKGYYLRMNEALHDKLKAMGYNCIFGFANHNSHYSYRRYLGWEDLGLLTCFRITSATAKSRWLARSELSTEVISSADIDLEDMSYFFVTGDKYHILRSMDFLHWRLLDSPLHDYQFLAITKAGEILAYAVFKLYQNAESDIMEIFVNPDCLNQQGEILSAVTKYFLDSGYGSVNLWSNLFSDEHLILEKLGFREIEANTYFGVIDFSGNVGVSDIHNWHYRFLDSDVY